MRNKHRLHRGLAAYATIALLMVVMLPLMAFGSSESQGQQQDPKCYEKIEEHDWVRYRVQKREFPDKAVSGNVGEAYWIAANRVVDRDPLTINPLGDHNGHSRVVDVSRFNVVGNGYGPNVPEGKYIYRLKGTENKSQVEKPQGDGWIDLGGNGNMVNGKEIPCPTTTTTTEPTTTTTMPTTTTTVPVPDMCPAELPVVKATNLDHNGWTIGDATFVSGGIEIEVSGDWEEVSISRAFNKSLQELGDILDIDATPLQYVGLHLHTSKGIIVYEEEPTYNGNLWSWGEFGVGAGMGYTSFASLEAYVAANPDLVVTQVDVLYTHPEESSTVVASVIFGCEEFIFDLKMREVIPAIPTTTDATCEEDGTIVLPPDTDDITYSLVEGGVLATLVGEDVKFGDLNGYVDNKDGTAFFAITAPEATNDCPATPVEPEVTQSGKCEAEGFFVIPDTEGVIYLVDGEAKAAGTVITGPGTFEVTAIAAEGFELTEELDITITLDPADDCVTAVPPTVIEGEACGVNDSFTIPSTEGVIYLVNGQVAEAGAVFNTPGTYNITVQAADGFELTNPEFMGVISLDAGEPCPVVTTPTTTPEELPFTGLDSDVIAALAVVLIALGGLVLAVSRKLEGGSN